MAKKDQPAFLRLVKSEHLDLCSSYNSTAASPLGPLERPCSMSQTDCGSSPMYSPISASVSPGPSLERRSDMRDAHAEGVMRPNHRISVVSSQRHSYTEFRNNGYMPRPSDLPRFDRTGERVRYWRKKRGIKQTDLAKKVGLTQATLSDLENGRSDGTGKMHLIAAALGLNPHYLETDKGEPEAGIAQEPPPPEDAWPFAEIPRSRLDQLNGIELKYAGIKLREILDEIEAERRKNRRAG